MSAAVGTPSRQVQESFSKVGLGEFRNWQRPASFDGFEADIEVRKHLLSRYLEDPNEIPEYYLVRPGDPLDGLYDYARLKLAKELVFKSGSDRRNPVVVSRDDQWTKTRCSTTFADAGVGMVVDNVYWLKLVNYMAAQAARNRHPQGVRGGKDSQYVQDLLKAMNPEMKYVAQILTDEVPYETWRDATRELDGPERKARARRRKIGAVSTLLAAVLATGVAGNWEAITTGRMPTAAASAQPSPSPSQSPSETKYERINEGVCLDPVSESLLKSDCYKLPRVTDGGSFEVKPDARDQFDDKNTIGKIADGKYELDKLPKDYQDAFKAAMEDPLVRSMFGEVGSVPIYIRQVAESDEENAFFYIDMEGKKQFVFAFTTAETSEESLFNTWGSIRSTLVHEGGHGVFDEWRERAQAGDEETVVNIREIRQQCVALLGDGIERTRQVRQSELQGYLNAATTNLNKAYKGNVISKSTYTTLKNAVAKFMKATVTPNALSKELIDIDDDLQSLGCRLRNAYGIIFANLNESDLDIYSGISSELTDSIDAALSDYNSAIHRRITEDFQPITEGFVLDSLVNPYAGHPGDNVTEMVASAFDNARMQPFAYVDKINGMPLLSRMKQRKFLEALDKQAVRTGIAPTNFSYVISKIRTAA